jgi:hypothetical protein
MLCEGRGPRAPGHILIQHIFVCGNAALDYVGMCSAHGAGPRKKIAYYMCTQDCMAWTELVYSYKLSMIAIQKREGRLSILKCLMYAIHWLYYTPSGYHTGACLLCCAREGGGAPYCNVVFNWFGSSSLLRMPILYSIGLYNLCYTILYQRGAGRVSILEYASNTLCHTFLWSALPYTLR